MIDKVMALVEALAAVQMQMTSVVTVGGARLTGAQVIGGRVAPSSLEKRMTRRCQGQNCRRIGEPSIDVRRARRYTP